MRRLRAWVAALDAKAVNEHLKLISDLLNRCAVALIAIAFFRPLVELSAQIDYIAAGLALCLHMAAHLVVGFMRWR